MQSLSAVGLASLSSVLEAHDWSCVGPGVSTPLFLGRFLRSSYMSLSQGASMPRWQNPSGSRAEPPFGVFTTSQPWSGGPGRGAITGPLGKLVAEASVHHVRKAGATYTEESRGPRRGRSADTAVSSRCSRGRRRFQRPQLVVLRGGSGEAGRLKVTPGKPETKLSHLLFTC